MSNEVSAPVKNPVQSFIKNEGIQKMIAERLQKRAGQFTTSLLSLVNSNAKIAECTPITVVQAALTAAALDLPINQNLGFAFIVPYRNHGVMEAQFQMGWKGFVQLAQRSGKFKTINTTDIREGEIRSRDRMTGELVFDWNQDDIIRKDLPIIGYLAYFELINGFRKSSYMSREEIEHHAGRYSQSYKGGYQSPWKTDFDLMAQKTVLKLLLNKYAQLSTEMQEAIVSDQSVDDGANKRYVDNDNDSELENEKATDAQKSAILAANGVDDLSEPAMQPSAIPDKADPTLASMADGSKPNIEPKESVKEKAMRKYGNMGKGDDNAA